MMKSANLSTCFREYRLGCERLQALVFAFRFGVLSVNVSVAEGVCSRYGQTSADSSLSEFRWYHGLPSYFRTGDFIFRLK